MDSEPVLLAIIGLIGTIHSGGLIGMVYQLRYQTRILERMEGWLAEGRNR